MSVIHSPASAGPSEEATGQRRVTRVATEAAAGVEAWSNKGGSAPLHVHR